MTAATPATEILTLLHQYESLHANANDNLKSSIWNITKARRVGGGGSGGFGGVEYSPDDTREELRAQALLEWKEGGNGDSEPKLLNEESSHDDGGSTTGGGGGRFVLHLDGMKAAQQRAALKESNNNSMAENKENEGLRRRRGESEGKTNILNKWTSEEANNTIDDEEERLRNVDPLNLFGVPPPALRVAQAKSRSAIAYYVEVANLAKEIMKITNQVGTD